MQTSPQLAVFLGRLGSIVGGELKPAQLWRMRTQFALLLADPTLDEELLTHITDSSLRGDDKETSIAAARERARVASDAISHVGLAEILMFYNERSEALENLETAVGLALQQGRLVKYAHVAQLRACGALGEVSVAERAMQALLAYLRAGEFAAHDTKLELDIVEPLRRMGVREELLQSYLSFAAAL